MRYPVLGPVFAILAVLLATGAGNPRTAREHVVADGETLRGIANRAGVPATVIAEANGLYEPYAVKKGQRLVIPRQHVHRVKAGESGLSIAARYGVPFAQIAIANNLDAKGTVKLGQRLIIPAIVEPRPASAIAGRPTDPYFRRPHDGKVLLGHRVRADGKGHAGIDIAANPLDMVRAAASGIVAGIDPDDPRFGRVVSIDHGSGWTSLYGHLAKITVARGDVIKIGERVGLAGNAGQAARTELHFEIRHHGKAVDPLGKLPR